MRAEEPMRDEDLPDDFRAQMAAARALTEYEDRIEPRAAKAWYDAGQGLVMFKLKNGCVFGFPPPKDPYWGLAGATPEQLAQVEADDGGRLLYWEPLEDGIVIPGLLLHLLNVKEWCWKWFGTEKPDDYGSVHSDNGCTREEPSSAMLDVPEPVEHVGD